MKTNCPYCAEEIQTEAVKCKHCGEWLKPQENSIPKILKDPILLILVPLILLSLGGIFFAKTFFQTIKEGQTQTSPTLQPTQSPELILGIQTTENTPNPAPIKEIKSDVYTANPATTQPPPTALPTAIPSPQNIVIQVASINKTYTCQQLGADAIITADEEFIHQKDKMEDCTKEMESELKMCNLRCDEAHFTKYPYCSKDPDYNSCVNKLDSQRSDCYQKCVSQGKLKIDGCMTSLENSGHSLSNLVTKYCN